MFTLEHTSTKYVFKSRTRLVVNDWIQRDSNSLSPNVSQVFNEQDLIFWKSETEFYEYLKQSINDLLKL